MDVGLPDAELLSVLIWLDAAGLEAVERVCRRWRRLALSPPTSWAHRPRGRAWRQLGDRAAIVAQRITEPRWLRGHYRRTELPFAERTAFFVLDGPRVAAFCDRRVAVYDVRTLAEAWHLDLPSSPFRGALDGERIAVFLERHDRDAAADAAAQAAGWLNFTMPGRLYAGTAGGICATSVVSEHAVDDSEFLGWRGACIAYERRHHGRKLERLDAASGSVVRSLVWDTAGRQLDFRQHRTFAIEDGVGVGWVTRHGLMLDDGRSDGVRLLAMGHDPRVARHEHNDFRTYAHPDRHTLASLSREIADLPGSVVQVWDMRALARPRVVIHNADDPTISFLSFGRRVLRTLGRNRVHHYDLDTGAAVGDPYPVADPSTFCYVRCCDEASMVLTCRGSPVRTHVHSFDDTAR